MKEMIEAFMLVFAIGGLISWAAWHFTRRLAGRSWWWRVALCILFAVTLAPTSYHLFGGLVVCPAVVVLSCISNGEPSFCLSFGALPILVVTSLLLAIWSVLIHRRANHVA
jgi:hypothetical protein